MASRPRDERGLTESVQFALIWPLLVLLTLGIIQTGLWLHGRNVAQRAATAATGVARGSYGDPAEARQLATSLARAGGLTDVNVDLSMGVREVTVSVSAAAPAILDVGLGRIRESASAPKERVTQP